jgi:TRAP-type mannitol/chloroaromatic compound transport system permease small subunit
MQTARVFVRAVSAVNEWVGTACSLIMLPLIVLVVFEVVMRYVFQSPTIWGTEAITFVFAAYILLGGGYTLLHGSHVSMDVVYGRLRRRTRAILDVLTAGVVVLYCGLLVSEGGTLALEALVSGRRSGTDWNPLLFPVLLALPVGALLMLAQALAKLARDLSIAVRGEDLVDGH